MDVLFIDHYDSFSFNLIDWLQEALPESQIIRVPHDDLQAISKELSTKKPIVLSPGPKSPDEVDLSLRITHDFLGHVPILGVCLGHQILGRILGGKIVRSVAPFHGSRRKIVSKSESKVFFGKPMSVATYNSLVVDRGSVDERFVAAENMFGEIEAIEFLEGAFPAVGLQFHPESFLSENTKCLGKYWHNQVQRFYASKPQQ